MTAVEDTRCAVEVAPGERFRLTDVDFVTGRRYADLRFWHLPMWVWTVIFDAGVTAAQWDELVTDASVLEVPDLAGWLTRPKARPRKRARDDLINGKSYLITPWNELPGDLCESLRDVYGYTPAGWDREVAARAGAR